MEYGVHNCPKSLRRYVGSQLTQHGPLLGPFSNHPKKNPVFPKWKPHVKLLLCTLQSKPAELAVLCWQCLYMEPHLSSPCGHRDPTITCQMLFQWGTWCTRNICVWILSQDSTWHAELCEGELRKLNYQIRKQALDGLWTSLMNGSRGLCWTSFLELCQPASHTSVNPSSCNTWLVPTEAEV
jgi:hypothetical protein